MKLVIANKLYSSWSMRPWLAMRALGIPFEEVVIPLRQTDSGPRILAHSPSGKVPALIDGEIVVWESLAIIEYLAERFPDKGVWPKTSAARAHARAISNEMHAGFMALRQNCPMNLAKKFASKAYGADVMANVARIEAIWAEARSRFGAGNGGPFLYGQFSAADAMYAPVVTRFETYQLPVSDATRAYMIAVMDHPAFRAWRSDALAEPRSWDLAGYEEGHVAVEAYPRTGA
ncbi:MAG TPA: glutathione S-transferase family protein [Hyphomicrobiaceae bacterium]|nr:glutathione S-transferase family protein [Hyphomicrobiaceae bacterium]